MSNVKFIDIEYTQPYHWVQDLPESEAAFLAGLFLTECMGVELIQREFEYRPNVHGGQTAMVKVQVQGQEALAWPALDRLVDILDRAPMGERHRAQAYDLECGDATPCPITGSEQVPA